MSVKDLSLKPFIYVNINILTKSFSYGTLIHFKFTYDICKAQALTEVLVIERQDIRTKKGDCARFAFIIFKKVVFNSALYEYKNSAVPSNSLLIERIEYTDRLGRQS